MVVCLVAYQLTNINLGHFWDEAWVYAPAIRSMSQGIPSILPDAIPVDLSRGHPLLFQFLGGIWMKLFGISNASAHLFALLISCTLLSATYFLTRKSFGRGAAFAAILFMVSQPIFLAQSSMLYPEMLMSLGFLISLFAYVQKRNVLFALGLGVAIYSKESALVFIVAFLLWDVARIIVKDQKIWELKKFLIPVLVLASHPILLYLYHGWFLYPEHTTYINFDFKDIKFNMRSVFRFVFEKQGRGWVFYSIIVLGVMGLRLKQIWWNLLLIAVGFAAYKVFVWKWGVPDPLYVIIMLVAVVGPLVLWFFVRTEKEIKPEHHFIGIGFITVVGFILFSSMNFYTPRYMLVIVLLICSMGGIILWKMRLLPDWSKLLLTFVGASFSMYFVITEQNSGEINLGLYDDLRVQQNMVSWMVNDAGRDDLVCTNFVTANYLCNEYSGYVTSENFMFRWFPDICADCQDAEYIIYTRTSGGCKEPDQQLLAEQGYSKVFADTIGASYAVIWKSQIDSSR
jgi:4-amino-4-deoxy-L-arabinose transferase-like glycosyltransferase